MPEDDKSFFPNYAIVPVIRTGTLEADPGVEPPPAAMADAINDASMQRLNAQVDASRRSIEEVAECVLTERGLL